MTKAEMALLQEILDGVKANGTELAAFKTEFAELKSRVETVEKVIGTKATKQNKSSKKTTATATKKTQKFATRREAIEATYSEAERKAWGEAKRAERALQHQAYEMTNAQFSEKVEYKVWKAQYNANLVALKAAAK